MRLLLAMMTMMLMPQFLLSLWIVTVSCHSAARPFSAFYSNLDSTRGRTKLLHVTRKVAAAAAPPPPVFALAMVDAGQEVRAFGVFVQQI